MFSRVEHEKSFITLGPVFCRPQEQLPLGLIFFNTWFTDFFQNIKVGGGKKIKITKKFSKFCLFNLKHIWIREKKITKIV